MKYLFFAAIACPLMAASAWGAPQNAGANSTNSGAFAFSGEIVLQAENGQLNTDRVEIVEQSSFESGKGISLKANLDATVDSPDAPPDLAFKVKAAEAGRYVIHTHAATDALGSELMSKAKSKHESLFMKIAVGDARPVKRVVFVPWSAPETCIQTTGKFDLSVKEQDIRLWLPKGVRLDYLDISPYTPPEVPEAAASYRPKIVPPPSRPRLWVNEQSLPKVRANLTKGENAPLWEKVKEQAAKPYEFKTEPGAAINYDSALEKAAVNKAFVRLMTGDDELGRQAISLIRDYLAAVEFGNLLDITREIGRAIYAAAQVYDWCYDLMTEEDRRSIRLNLMRLADDMEIGWPPFLQGVVNGHGSEAQLHCHLLSMSIAIYDEDPLPYQYCAYRVLEELAPMRNFEYQSPRHNQGIGYGIYRFVWDMHAAWLFYRMSGRKVFDSNIEDVHKYWFYMRLPNGYSFPDGDGTADNRRTNLGATALLTYAYANDPIMKGDFIRQGGYPHDPILSLLLNDPNLKPADDFSSLPLTINFGPILGGMAARTGWKMGEGSSDVVVEMKGGGYHFGNHQHPDAGSFQIYYRGFQITDLGQYKFYGTPYDTNFNKRSISHSMMLAFDPDEKFLGGKLLNDGGARYRNACPLTPEMAQSDPLYANGTILSADFGPSRQKPSYTYFSVNLTSAYSEKIRDYVRTFCFLNLDNAMTPAALIILDNMETAKPEIAKYWQVNTLNPPETTKDGVILRNSDLGLSGKVTLSMLRPLPENRRIEILSGKESCSVFGHYLDPPKPDGVQAKGHRIMFSPKSRQAKDVFLTVMTMSDEEQSPLPVDLAETPEAFIISLADRMVVLSKTGELMKKAIDLETSAEGERQLLLAGLNPGVWSIRSRDGKVRFEARVEKNRNTAFFLVPKGKYMIEPATE
ncbi:hypothetical protein JW926_13700 [Candidatus Sumerlaeota bacterium]|nr:hypothetical protein [Candidatus Sumerlaeota bacterium]